MQKRSIALTQNLQNRHIAKLEEQYLIKDQAIENSLILLLQCWKNVQINSVLKIILHFLSTNIFLSILDELNSEIIP